MRHHETPGQDGGPKAADPAPQPPRAVRAAVRLPSETYLTFAGRLARGRWRRAAAILVAALLATYGVTAWLSALGALAPWPRDVLRTFVQFFLMGPWLAIDWKRFHDLGLSGAYALICPGLFVLSVLLDAPFLRDALPGYGTLSTVIAAAQLLVALWLAYALAICEGDGADNRFGAAQRR